MRRLVAGLGMVLFLFSSCAAGKTSLRDRERSRRPAPARADAGGQDSDVVRLRKSSYRVRGTDEVGSLNARQHAALRAKTQGWVWPLRKVALTSKFGFRDGDFHDGVDLRAPTGTPVYSVGPGTVIYSGSKISGYGRMVVVRHAGKLSTVYAHNSKLFVKVGQKVKTGQRIALSGNTGRSSGPHVHFEIREGVTAINPYILLISPASHNQTQERLARQRSNPAQDRVQSRSASSRRPAAASSGKSRTSGRPAARVVADDGFKARVSRPVN